MDLLNGDVKKVYAKYLMPALGSSMVSSIYTLTDAIVVGKGIGPDALAAMNLITPPYCLLMAVGILFGVGGSVHTSVQKGIGNKEKANRFFTLSFIGLLVAEAFLWLVYNIYDEDILILIGAKDNLMPYARDYMKYINIFLPLMSLCTYLSIYVRADGSPNQAMNGVICGGIINVALDIILVFPLKMGIGGAALASMLGICAQDIICGMHFLSKKNTLKLIKPHNIKSSTVQILISGMSGFIGDLANGFIVCLFNVQMLKYCGETALSVYSVIANCVILFNSLFTGVGQAMQPIVSTNYGAGKSKRILKVRKMAYCTILLLGCVFTLAGVIAPIGVTKIFIEVTPEIREIADYALRLYFIAFVPMGINVLTSYYMQSVLRSTAALCISFLRNIALSGLLLLIMPVVFGGNSLWIVMVIVDLCVCAISLTMLRKTPLSH